MWGIAYPYKEKKIINNNVPNIPLPYIQSTAYPNNTSYNYQYSTPNIPSTPAQSASAANVGMDDLKKLKELLDDGIITNEEFEAKKKQILGL